MNLIYVNRLRRLPFVLLSWVLLSLALVAHAGIEDGVVDQNQLGDKYSPLKQINRSNVTNLEKAWEYHTGDLPPNEPGLTSFQDQPSLIEGNLVV